MLKARGLRVLHRPPMDECPVVRLRDVLHKHGSHELRKPRELFHWKRRLTPWALKVSWTNTPILKRVKYILLKAMRTDVMLRETCERVDDATPF